MLTRLAGLAFFLGVAAEAIAPAAGEGLGWWHGLPAFFAVYGALGCAVLVLVSKALGKLWLQRPEADDD